MPSMTRWRLPLLVFIVAFWSAPAWAQNPNVTVDDQPTAEQKLEQVLELRRAKRYAEAVELVQELIESSQFKLVALGEGKYTDAGRWAGDVLLRDGELRQAYTERYSAAAERVFEQASGSDQRLQALLTVYRLYRATPAGLEAGLSAAGLLLESGQAQSAATLIAELVRHPDRQAFGPTLAMLRGSTAAYLQDADLLAEVVADLGEIDAGLAAQLTALAQSIQPMRMQAGQAQADAGPKPISIRAPLWDQALATADNAQRWQLDDRSVTPVITPSIVLVNNGRQVVALDRASGQRAWAYPSDDDSAVQRIITAQRWLDGRAVARGQGRVAAVLGELHGITERRNPYVPPNQLACVDEQTGKLLWQRTAASFRDDEPRQASERRIGRINLQHTHFLGTPLISEGKVFVLMRRANSEADSQSSWLMVYDVEDGGLIWYRHLALVSLSYTNADSMRVGPRLTQHGDMLYISDGLGTIGAIDMQTGGYRWLRVLPVGSENTRSIVASTRGPISAPVMTSSGLLVPLSLSNNRLMLVDPEDGSVLRSFKEDPVLNKTQYILEAGGGALAVSQTAVSFWDADKAAIAWTFTFAAGEVMRGMGDVSLRYAVLPTSQRLLVLDLATGQRIDDAPSAKGSVVVHDGEVLGISEGRLHAYTSWERVYDRLVEQVETRPDDPSAGLSLASIAMRQDGQELSVLQGIGHALKAVSRQQPRRKAAVASHVFDQLRLLIPKTDDPTLRRQLYDRLALLTQTATQEAAYHLDAGLFFASAGETQRAIDHLHAVIGEPVFAAASYELEGLSRPAGSIAQQSIEQLIERYGREVYARQDAMAQAMINELKAADELNAVTLTAVARRYPLSPIAGQLLLEAAEVRASDGQPIAAVSLYKQALQRSVDDAQRQHAAGRLMLFYLKTGRPTFASDLLDRLTTRYPGLLPTIEGQTLTLEEWGDRIAEVNAAPVDLGPLAASLGTPILINGRLISEVPGLDAGLDASRVYLHQADDTITSRSHNEPGRAQWSAKVPANSGRLLLLADESGQALFWAVGVSQVLAFDSVTGEALWQAPLSFDTSGDKAAGQFAQPSERSILIAVSETVVCFAHRDSSQVIAIDRASGDLLWRTRLEMTALTAMDADNWSLAIVGRAGHPQQLRSGKLAVLSLSDAQPILDEGQARIALTPFGVDIQRQSVTVLGTSGVLSVQVPTGKVQWSQRFAEKMLTGAYAIAGPRIAVETNDGEVQMLDASNQGKPMGAVTVRGGGNIQPTQLMIADGTVWCLSQRGVFRFGQWSELTWSDAIQSPNTTASNLIIGREHTALIAQPGVVPFNKGPSVYLFESAGGRLIEQYDIGPLGELPKPQDTMRLGSGLAMPVGSQTLVIPPAE
ncbi:MAG: PQQ-binding-like beta-propeller repeat protein [Planctomycetota bacterium]